MSKGWSALKRDRVETAFYQFLKRAYVNSKDAGQICIGDNLYQGQIDVITQIFDALEAGIHKIYILKSRQLGISTIIRFLIIFLLGIHKGLKGAIVFDTDNNKSESRAEIEVAIGDLPDTLKFPTISSNNRAGLTLENDSKVLFMSAGVKKSKSSGTLGRSVGLTIAHCSELCSWDNDDGLEAFEQSLSEIHPDRLYIYESTARGFNRWNTMWEDARKDPMHCKCIFLGWWSKGTQAINRDDIDWSLYGEDPPDDKERLRIKEVKERYEFDVTQEQLAWYRRKMDPTRGQVDSDASDAARYEQNTLRMQEQPWCVTADTRVGTPRGIVPITEASIACAQGRIVARGPTGRAPIWRVVTALGYQVSGTGNHPIVQADGSLVDLSQSMGKRVRLQPPLFGCHGLYQVEWTEPPIASSIEIGADLARFVGLFMGDGSASAKFRSSIVEVSVCCDAKDVDVVEECERLFTSVFGVHAHRNARAGWVTVRTGQKHVLQTLKRLNLLREDSIKTQRRVHVPEFIWRSPQAIVREFLIGLFEADGFNAYETVRVALFSKYPEFVRDVQLLLLAFGITSRSVEMKKRAGDGHFYTGRQLELRACEAAKFNEEIGFISERKRGRYRPLKLSGRGVASRKPIVFEDTIVKVEDTGNVEEVWNLTVEGSHLFDANGILTHNTEDEAFQQTGAVFFANKDLTDLTNNYASHKYKPYMFLAGEEFSHMQIHRADNPRSCELKVWEEPDPEGVYVFGVDPAYGENENNCNSAIQILRCYADGVDQVAEYAWPLQTTRHLAWTLAALLGWYGASPRAECRYILELNGPGTAVFNEIKSLKFYIENAVFIRKPLEDIGLQDIFKNVKTYIFSRPDSMGAGYNYHWLTNTRLKVTIMEQLRDIASNGKMRVRSHDLIKEMRSIRREGDSIGADSSMRDDRAVAMALANYYWATKIRQGLVGARRTRAAEESRQRLSIVDQVGLFQQNMLENFFSGKAAARRNDAIQQTRNAWRNGSGRRY